MKSQKTSFLSINLLFQAFHSIKKSPHLFLKAIAFELLFFFSLGFFLRPLLTKVVTYSTLVGNAIAEKANVLTGGSFLSSSVIKTIFSDAEVTSFIWPLITLLLLSLFVLYVLWSFFEGLSFFFCEKIVGRGTEKYSYLRRFFVLNLFWIPFFLAQHILSFYATLRERILLRLYPDMSFSYFSLVIELLFLLLIYVAILSYANLRNHSPFEAWKKSFSFITVNLLRFFPMLLIIVLLVMLANFSILLAIILHPLLLIPTGLIVVLPIFAFGKVYILTYLQNKK